MMHIIRAICAVPERTITTRSPVDDDHRRRARIEKLLVARRFIDAEIAHENDQINFL
jgi:hypothetical protein